MKKWAKKGKMMILNFVKSPKYKALNLKENWKKIHPHQIGEAGFLFIDFRIGTQSGDTSNSRLTLSSWLA